MLRLLEKKASLDDILIAIACADDGALSEIIETIIQTYYNRYPDQDILFLSMPKNDPDERQRILDALNRLAFE